MERNLSQFCCLNNQEDLGFSAQKAMDDCKHIKPMSHMKSDNLLPITNFCFIATLAQGTPRRYCLDLTDGVTAVENDEHTGPPPQTRKQPAETSDLTVD